MKIVAKAAFLILSSLALASCGMPDIRIKHKVAETEVVGTWHLDPKSSALAEDHDGDDYVMDATKPHTIVFSADGTCHYRSVLQMPTRYIDAVGQWKTSSPSDKPEGSEVQIELNMPDGGTQMISLDIREDSGELILWTFWSDPDLWNFIEYKQ